MYTNFMEIAKLYDGFEIFPVEITLVMLTFSGHLRKGNKSVSFLIYF